MSRDTVSPNPNSSPYPLPILSNAIRVLVCSLLHKNIKHPFLFKGHSSTLSSDADSDCQSQPTTSAIKKQKHSINQETVLLQDQDVKWDAIGRSIGLQLRGLDKDQQTVAHKLINDVMYYAESGMLSPHCSICLDTPLGHTLNAYDSPSENRHLDIDDPIDPIIP